MCLPTSRAAVSLTPPAPDMCSTATAGSPGTCESPVAETATGDWPSTWSMIDRSCTARSQSTFTSCWKRPRLMRVESTSRRRICPAFMRAPTPASGGPFRQGNRTAGQLGA